MLRPHIAISVLAAACTFGAVQSARAQQLPLQEQLALQKQLEGATRLECSFTALAAGSWVDGAGQMEVRNSPVTVTFTEVNVDEGTAEAESRYGASFIAVRFAGGYLHLMQAFSSGPLYTTTVIARPTTEGRLMAIHTRHEYAPASVPGFTSQPEMYVGDCAVGE